MPGANPLKGEVLLGGRKLRIDFNAVCALEDATGRVILDLLADIERGMLGFRDLRQWVHVFMEDEASPEDAGNLLNEVGYGAALKAVVDGLNAFFPKEKAKAKNPPKAE